MLGPLLLTMFVNEIPSIVSSTFLMFADETKIFRVIRNGDDYTALQNDLDLLYRWSQQWQLKCNVTNCKRLHCGPAHYRGLYYLNGMLVNTITSHSDLGLHLITSLRLMTTLLKSPPKLNEYLKWFKKSFEYLNSTMLTQLFSTLVWPILEYSNTTWGPHYTVDMRKIEKVEWRATHFLPQLHDKSYTKRLILLSLPPLQYRRLRGNQIFLYKILNNSDFFDLYTYSTITTTRGIILNCSRIIM